MAWYDAITDFIKNAATGNLSQSQVDAITAQAQADVYTAARGADPAVITYRQKQVVQDINNTLSSFDKTGALPGSPANFGLFGSDPLASASAGLKTGVKLVVWITIAVALLYSAPVIIRGVRRV